jgi:UDP-N-acetylmuramoylalanine--D-glutamate ligase
VTGRTIAVIGFGVTGRAVARALANTGDTPLVFDDSCAPDAVAAAKEMGVDLQRTPPVDTLRSRLDGCDLVVPSPGVPFGHPVYGAAAAAGVPVRAEIELAADMARRAGRPAVVAITGTNGKTTVTTLVTGMLRASGRDAIAAGNIGVPMIEAVASGPETVVAEVSSFQLQFTQSFRPEVSCWLNLAPDHLDWHPSLAHYRDAKARIWANQRQGDTAVVNADDPAVSAAAGKIDKGVRVVTFTIHEGTGHEGRGHPGADFRVEGDHLAGPDGATLIDLAELPRALPHDLANALAAAAVARSAGATPAGCREALVSTLPLPHRVSFVGEGGGVRWYDDSKATTPASVQAAVAGFSSVVLIAGGRNKGLDLGVLGETVPPVRAVVAIGEAAPELEAAFTGLVPVRRAGTMEAAVRAAVSLAEPGDSVLLSPGCASFDWYTSYAARGEHFASIVTRQLENVERAC